jgi:hypothetical protein
MASPNTKLDPIVANRVAGDHRETAANIGQQMAKFNGAVDLMEEYCDGQMMKALTDARDAWSAELKLVIADLNEMAGNVDGTVQDFDETDHANAGQIGQVGVGILRDI